MLERIRAVARFAVGLTLVVTALASCDVGAEPTPVDVAGDPVEEVSDGGGAFDHLDFRLEPAETVWEGVSGHGSLETVIDTTGIGAYVAIYARCLGDDLVVDVAYTADDPADAFTPVCDGVMNRQQVYLGPDHPVDEITVRVTGVGDWAVAVVENEDIAASIEAGVETGG